MLPPGSRSLPGAGLHTLIPDSGLQSCENQGPFPARICVHRHGHRADRDSGHSVTTPGHQQGTLRKLVTSEQRLRMWGARRWLIQGPPPP